MQKIDPSEVKNVLSNIKAYDNALTAINGIKPVHGVVHSIASLEQYVQDFKNDICPKLNPAPAGYSWQVGIYPMAQKDAASGIQYTGLYFIPTLAKDGFETMRIGDPNAANIILDYRTPANLTHYNNNNVYIEDLGTSWP